MQYNQEEVTEIFEIVFDLSAKEIFEKVEKVRNRPEIAQRRWFWELLQNAKDAVKPSEQVSVKLILAKNTSDSSYVEFQHNGNPFRYKDARNLIFPYSDKNEEDNSDKSGKFGTGFLATHILSNTIQVQGIYHKEENSETQYFDFSFLLDRTGVKKNDISQNINASWKEFKTKQIRKFNYSYSPLQQSYETRFRYNLNSHTESIAEKSLVDIQQNLPYILAFIPKIKKIEIFNSAENQTTIFQRHTEPTILSQNVRLFEIVRQQSNQMPESIKIVSCFDTDIEIALQIEQNNGATSIVPFKDNQPFVFTPFPSIASKENSISLPFVVNSVKFTPKEERDGVWLNNEGYGSANQTLFEKVKPLYWILLNFASQHNWENTYLLLQHLKSSPSGVSDFNPVWFRDKIQNDFKAYSLQVPIVETNLGIRKAINTPIFFPSDANEENRNSIWNFVVALFPEISPKQADLHNWYHVSWEGFTKISISELTKRISQYQNIDNLSLSLKMPKAETLKWVNNVVDFVVDKEPNLLNEQDHKILPNQSPTGTFTKKADLWLDNDTIDDDLKIIISKIAKLTGKISDWRNAMLDKSIYPAKLNFPHDRVCTIQLAGSNISEIVKEVLKNDSPTNEFRDLFSDLLNWLSENPKKANEYFKGLKTESLLYRTANDHKIKLFTSILQKDRNGDLPLERLDNPNLTLILDLGEKVLNSGYTKEDISKFLSIPKGEQVLLTREEYENLKASNNTSLPINWNEIKFNRDEEESVWKKIALFFLETLGEIGIQDVQTYLFLIGKVKNKEILIRSDKVGNIPDLEFDKANYKIQITSEAVAATIPYLEKRGYTILEFDKEYPNILKVTFKDRMFKIVIRPSHGRRYQVHSNERNILMTENAELWLSDGFSVVQETLNALMFRIFSSGTVFIPTESFVPGRLIGQ